MAIGFIGSIGFILPCHLGVNAFAFFCEGSLDVCLWREQRIFQRIFPQTLLQVFHALSH